MLQSIRALSFAATLLVCLVAMQPTESSALYLVTSNPSEVGQFQMGATVENFDDLPALTLTSYRDDQIVPAANQFSSRNLVAFTSPFFTSGLASFNDPVGNPGTRIGIFDPDGAIAGDVKSPNNVAGPLLIGTDEAFTHGVMEVIFPADVIRVGFWITRALDIGIVFLRLKDSNNTDLTTGTFSLGVSGDDKFIGIQRDSADIRAVTIDGFGAVTIDDFTYSSTAMIPEPSSSLLVAMGLTALVGWRRVRRSNYRQRYRSQSPPPVRN